MKSRVLILTILFTLDCFALGQEKNFHQQAIFNVKLGDIDRAVFCYAQAVEQARTSRSAGKGVSGYLLAEYAYALALHHDFEAALMYIDRALALEPSGARFFAGQILTIMGHTSAATQLTGSSPTGYNRVPGHSDWIDGIYQNLTPKYSTKVTLIRESPQEAVTRAMNLIGRKQYVQAIVIYEELTAQYPDNHIIPIGYSTLWENLGNNVYAATLLKRGLESKKTLDTTGTMAYRMHLQQLESVSPSWWELIRGMRMIAYMGSSISTDAVSLNARVGVVTEKKFSTSLNASVMFKDSLKVGNIGISVYKTWRIFVFGLGVSCQLSPSGNTWGLAPSVGFTFINRTQTRSLDITLSGQLPFSQIMKPNLNISLGTTFYLDLKKEKR